MFISIIFRSFALKITLKTRETNKILEEICKYGLTPNEYFALSMILQDKPLPDKLSHDKYRRYLFINDWITMYNKATPKLIESGIFEDVEDINFTKNVETYRSLWPAITLPTGRTARSTSIDLQSRFKWFFKNYNYDWDIVLKATEHYITYYRDRNYAYMRTSSYFIYKEETTKLRTSTLAEWCDRIQDGVIEENYHMDI